MREPLLVELPYPPSANRYWRSVGRGRVVVSAEAKRYRGEVERKLAGRAALGATPVEVSVVAHPADRRRRDLDNLAKVLLDALANGGAFADDGQVRALHLWWGEVSSAPCVEVVVREFQRTTVGVAV